MMNRNQAMREARKRWGTQAMIKDLGKRAETSREHREAAIAAAMPIRERLADPSISDTERKALKKHLSDTLPDRVRYRFQVGKVGMGGMFFLVLGYADTWEDAFRRADSVNKPN